MVKAIISIVKENQKNKVRKEKGHLIDHDWEAPTTGIQQRLNKLNIVGKLIMVILNENKNDEENCKVHEKYMIIIMTQTIIVKN